MMNFKRRVTGVATGGLSIPKMGATAFGYDLARQFGLKIFESRPALVPLTLTRMTQLISVTWPEYRPKSLRRLGRSFREKMLITHRGLSGPAILQISSYWDSVQTEYLDLARECELTAATCGL